ncbi:MAG: FAD-binding oxidoreductase, partial [Acidimicrobiia bacterium]
SATGPDLTQVFVGSEGTLGIITCARLRLHPKPPAIRSAAYAFDDFASGIDACRRILRRGATPAVLRLYDNIEGERNFQLGAAHPLLVRDEGDATIIDAAMRVVGDECAGRPVIDANVVETWMSHRNDVSALEHNIRAGAVVDTMEIAVNWGEAAAVYEAARAAIGAVDGTVVVSAHLSHSYVSGCCLYFTFGGLVDAAAREQYYTSVWNAGQRAVLRAGGNLSHHHGVGINRARFMSEALGASMRVFESIKVALDPNGILNPGKLGLGSTGW